MRGRGADWPHLPQNYREACLGQLPSGFGTGETAARNMNSRSQPTIIAVPMIPRRAVKSRTRETNVLFPSCVKYTRAEQIHSKDSANPRHVQSVLKYIEELFK